MTKKSWDTLEGSDVLVDIARADAAARDLEQRRGEPELTRRLEELERRVEVLERSGKTDWERAHEGGVFGVGGVLLLRDCSDASYGRRTESHMHVSSKISLLHIDVGRFWFELKHAQELELLALLQHREQQRRGIPLPEENGEEER